MIPPALLEPCHSGDDSSVATVDDLAAFSIQQEAALQACEAKRNGLVELIAKDGR